MLETATHSNETPAQAHTSPELQKGLLLDGNTIGDAFLRRVKMSPTRAALVVKKKGKFEPMNWEQVNDTVLAIGAFLKSKKITKSKKVAILSQTKPEWFLTDLSILCHGAVTVPIYQSSLEEDVAYILENSGASLIFIDDQSQLDKLKSVFKQTKKKLPIVAFNEGLKVPKELEVISFREIFKNPKPTKSADFEKQIRAIKTEDLASVVYTSGTTGTPKGVMLTQGNIASTIRGGLQHMKVDPDNTTLTFLPLAHVLGRFESFLSVFAGFTLGFAESINAVADNLRELRPNFLISVPRIYEKIYTRINAQRESQPDFKKKLLDWAVETGKQVSRLEAEKIPVPLRLSLKHKVATQLVLNKISSVLGGQLDFPISGGAPLSKDLCEFFHACGIRIMEGYGLTETFGPCFVNVPHDYRFGTVGKPFPNVEVKIAEDGEILLKGPTVFKGYYKNPNATEKVFTADGWFCTGDIGIIDDRGFLKITDRKKEIIVTSGGKNVAPQKIENLVKLSKYVSQFMVFGDKKKYLTALVTLEEPEIKRWAKAESVSLEGPLHQSKEVRKLLQSELAKVNRDLASYESVKKFQIVPEDFTVENGLLTPSLKMKRKPIIEKYKELIESMY